MKTLNLQVDLEGIKFGDDLKDKSSAEVASEVIQNIILSYGMQERGLSEEDRRKYYKICDALEKAIKSHNGVDTPCNIELEDDWMGFLRKCKRESKLMPNKLIQRVEAIIDAVKDR